MPRPSLHKHRNVNMGHFLKGTFLLEWIPLLRCGDSKSREVMGGRRECQTKMQTNLVARACVRMCVCFCKRSPPHKELCIFFFFFITSEKTKAKFSIIFFLKCKMFEQKKVKVKNHKKESFWECVGSLRLFFFIPPHNILLFYCWIITPGKIKVSPSRELSSGRETSSFSVVFALKGVWDRRLTSLNRSLGMWEPCRMETSRHL